MARLPPPLLTLLLCASTAAQIVGLPPAAWLIADSGTPPPWRELVPLPGGARSSTTGLGLMTEAAASFGFNFTSTRAENKTLILSINGLPCKHGTPPHCWVFSLNGALDPPGTSIDDIAVRSGDVLLWTYAALAGQRRQN